MNVEEMVPELFVGHDQKSYYCQRCLNHGRYEKRKNHKAMCPFGFCSCYACQMVDKRRELNSLLVRTKSEDDPTRTSDPNANSNSLSINLFTEKDSIKERMPRCQRCAQHNVLNRLKGHKRTCPFLDCNCAKCQVVFERQRLMADQIKLRRRQKKQKKAAIEQNERALELTVQDQIRLPPFLMPLNMSLPSVMPYGTISQNGPNSELKGIENTNNSNPTAFCLLSILRAQNLLHAPNFMTSLFPQPTSTSNDG